MTFFRQNRFTTMSAKRCKWTYAIHVESFNEFLFWSLLSPLASFLNFLKFQPVAYMEANRMPFV